MTHTKTIIGIFAVAVLIGGGAYVASRPETSTKGAESYTTPALGTGTSAPLETMNPGTATTPTAPATTPKTTTTTPKTTTTPSTPKVTSYTEAQVAVHDSSASCWTIVNGNVYDVTSWISRHPGGAGAIKGMCGVDASDEFNEQHGGDGGPERILAGFKIGTLK